MAVSGVDMILLTSNLLIICHLFLLLSLPPSFHSIYKCGSLAGQCCLNSFLSVHSRIMLGTYIYFALVREFIFNCYITACINKATKLE